MVKVLLSFLVAGLVGFCTPRAQAQNLPSGYIGTVNQTATGIYQQFSYSYTAPTTGVDYIGLAFRQDPGYWSVGSFKLTAQGSTTNLLNNPNLQYGGNVSQYGLQAPADWGVWYQSSAGAPPAAGMWYGPGSGWMGSTTAGLGVNTGTSGSWIDGAVGSYDGIYQGFNATAGTTYNFSFYSDGTNSYSNPSIMIGVYAGACAAGSNIFNCTPVTTSGFTAAATPQATQGTGGAPTPPPDTGGGSTAPTYSSSITTSESALMALDQSYVNAITSNSIYIDQVGNNDRVTINQNTKYNAITGYTQNAVLIRGGNNNITMRQGDPNNTASTHNLMQVDVLGGGGNTLNLNQGTDTNGNGTGTDAGHHYLGLQINGSSNSVTTQQQTTNLTVGNYTQIAISGNANNVGVYQTGSAPQQSFNVVNGSSNTLSVTQQGTSTHFSDVTLTGNSNSATISQSNTGATGSNAATIVLNNSGGPTSLNLTQTGGQVYSINQTCTSSAGCGTITVRQGN
jgi:hypothetical protein